MLMSPDITTSIFLASFTTAHARLRLYSVLDQLGENVLYFNFQNPKVGQLALSTH